MSSNRPPPTRQACTVRWLMQAGASVDFIHLADLGIRSNGHMVMLEKNNLDVAAIIGNWISRSLGTRPPVD